MLEAREVAGYVRSVIIRGSIPVEDLEEEREYDAFSTHASPDKDDMVAAKDDSEEEGDVYWTPSKYRPIQCTRVILSERQMQARDKAWMPVARLISMLSGLQDLVHACADQISPCLLTALHQHHPASRLHIPNFCLRSLIRPRNEQMGIDQKDIDLNEFALVTSPCLYSINVLCARYQPSELMLPHGPQQPMYVDYNQEAVKSIVGGLAPRLRHVSMAPTRADITRIRAGGFGIPRPPWQGFFPSQSSKSEPGTGHLESLILFSGISRHWRKCNDFESLHHLKMFHHITVSDLLKMAAMGAEGKFASLASLDLSSWEMHDDDAAEIAQAKSQILQTVKPLERLRLQGFLDEGTLDTITRRHAKTLRRLRFEPVHTFGFSPGPFVVSQYHVQELAEQCTRLEHLELLVPRREGNEDEVATYRALSRFPRLSRLDLHLDCSSAHVPGHLRRPGPEELAVNLDSSYRVTLPVYRTALINASVDSTLALAIFRIIGSGNTLTHLRILVEGTCDFGHSDQYRMSGLGDFMAWVGRRWSVKKVAGGDAVATERNVERRIKALDWLKGFEYRKMSTDSADEMYKAGWESLWGEMIGEFWNNWKSFPLAEEVG